MVTDVFIKRPVLATVCSVLITLAGAISIPTLPIGRYPELAPPTVTVGAFYTGANAQAVESAVTTPLESVINGVEGMLYMSSASTNNGFCQITVTFEVGRDPDLAAVDVQNRVNSALGRMPLEVRTNGITVSKGSAGFLAGIGFYSDNNRYSSLFISNYLDRYVRDGLKRVPGVANVIIFGERRFAMRLWLDPNRLAGRGLTASDVTNALREQNVQVAAGSVGAEPSSEDQMYQLSVRAAGRLTEVREFEDIVVNAGQDGALVRVRDIGRVELGAEDYSSRLRFAGVEASGIGIMLLPTANALEVFRGVNAEMERIEGQFPPGLKWQLAFDNVVVVRESIIEVLKTLGEAIALVILVMFLFLQNWRSTLIPAITIPVSLIGTFAFVKLLGYSINTLTLFGIVLATGIVVDDAIVVIENIERHMREFGKSAHDAAVDAMREVFSAVVVIGIVLVAVFLPVAFFPGTTGRMYQQFAMTITFAVILSVFNAVTFTPALSALLLDKETHTHGRFFTGVNRVIDGGTNVYVRAVSGALRWKWAMAVVFVLSLGATWWVYRAVPGAFVPAEDEGYFITIVQAPSGASIEYTTNIMKDVEQIYFKQPEIAGVFSVAGFSFSGAASNNGLMFARLKGFEEREGAEHSLDAVLNRLRGEVFGIPGAMVIPVAPPSIQGVSSFGGFQMEILDLGRWRYHRISGSHAAGGRRGQSIGPRRRIVLRIYRERPAARCHDRSRQGALARTADPRGDRRAIGAAGLPVRERLRLQQPRVSRLRAGRSAVPRAADRPQPVLRARVEWRHGAAVCCRTHVRDDGARGHQSLQSFPLDGNYRRRPAGGELGSGTPADGADRPGDAAAGLRLRVGGSFARRGEVGQPGGLPVRPVDRARVSGARSAVRELDSAVHHPARRAARGLRGAERAVDSRILERRVLSGRSRHAHRAGRQELDPDRRVRRAASRTGPVDRRRRD